MGILDVDKKIAKLSGLARDFTPETYRWNLVMNEIDRLLDERGKLSLEERYNDNDNSL